MAAPQIEGLEDFHEIGRGGFGVVYRASQPAFGRAVAVKILRGAHLSDEAGTARFRRECLAVGSVSGHPNIVRVFAAGVTEEGEPYLVMDYLPGGSLAERVKEEGPLSVERALAVGIGVAGALETAHRAGVIHRDVKPENVLFSQYGEPALVDFGIARIARSYETRSGTISATIAHASPEVISGAEAIAASDTYSLGSSVYYALTGEAAFVRHSDETIAPILARIATEPVPDLRARGVPDVVAAVIEKSLAKEARDRYPDAAAFGAALQAAAEQLGISAPTMAIPTIDGADEPMRQATASEPPTNILPTDESSTPQPLTTAPIRTTSRRSVVIAVTTFALLAIVAAVVLRQDRPKQKAIHTGSASSVVSTSTTKGTTVTAPPPTEGSTTPPVEPTVTPPPPTVHKPIPPTVGPTVPPTTPPTSPPTEPSTPLARVPSAVRSATSRDPRAGQVQGDIPQTITITLNWAPPGDDGGDAPRQYHIRCTLMQGTAVYQGDATPAPCKGGVELPAVSGGTTSTTETVSRIEPGLTWLKWEIAAGNSAGIGPYEPAVVVVPALIGLHSWYAFDFGRVAGVMTTGGKKTCSAADTDTVCDQTERTGSQVPAGTNLVLWFPS